MISQQAIDATTSYIEQTSPVSALARLLAAGRDDAGRAMRCRGRSVAATGPA
jgi:hypothetical protein